MNPRRAERWRRVFLVVVGGLVLAGCRIDLDLDVAVDEDGSGVVEVDVGLDDDAVNGVGGDLQAVLELDDLRHAGWTVDGPKQDEDGLTRVRARHGFGTPAEVGAVVEEVAGAGGPFQGFAVRRATSFGGTEWAFRGRIDFAGGLEAFGDDALAAAFDGEPLGQTVEEIETQAGQPLSEIMQLRVAARLPGEVTSNDATAGDGAVWRVPFGEGPVVLEATGRQRRMATLLLTAVALGAALALVVVLGFRLAHRRKGAARA